jgi:DnaJ-domain-containing protein 1
MPEAIRVTASLRMNCTPAQARAQYRDIDHHIRNDVHPSIRYQWEPASPGERKIRTTFRILGVPQFDVSLLEDAPDGSFLIRYLEGSNAGMLLVHEFVEVEPGVTEVRLSADAPATWGRRLLGPLFVIGARQVMKKALAEDKRDLERGDYRPGSAAGNVESALVELKAFGTRPQTEKAALLDAACVLCVSDGNAESAEVDALRRLAELLGADVRSDSLDERIRALLELERSDGFAAEVTRIGSTLRALGLGREGVIAAAVVGLVSEGLSAGELAVLETLAQAAGVKETDVANIVTTAEAALNEAATLKPAGP